jgi:hypothetical protein
MPKHRKTPPELIALRRRFNVALAEAGLSVTKWSAENDWSRAHVVLTLSGDRESEYVLAAVRSFVSAWEEKIAKRLARAS